MRLDLHLLVEQVSDEATFIEFVRCLGRDFAQEARLEQTHPSSPHGQGALGWENRTIDSMLEAATAWAEDSRGNYDQAANPWLRCARILFAGKFYE